MTKPDLKTLHTPAPWHFQEYQSGYIEILMRAWNTPPSTGYEMGYLAANVNIFNIHDQDEAKLRVERYANSRLIAAAPELLQMLEVMTKHVARTLYPEHPDVIKSCELIAKAEGTL